ncbi:MAG: hypothetical protein VW985_08290 [Gammaproteobacteria bacterium]
MDLSARSRATLVLRRQRCRIRRDRGVHSHRYLGLYRLLVLVEPMPSVILYELE